MQRMIGDGDGAGVLGRWVLEDETRLGLGSWRLFRDFLLHEMRVISYLFMNVMVCRCVGAVISRC